MAGAYYRPPEKRVTANDYMAERHYQREPLAIGITAAGRTEIVSVTEAERIVAQVQTAIRHAQGETPEVRAATRRWK